MILEINTDAGVGANATAPSGPAPSFMSRECSHRIHDSREKLTKSSRRYGGRCCWSSHADAYGLKSMSRCGGNLFAMEKRGSSLMIGQISANLYASFVSMHFWMVLLRRLAS